MSDNIFNDKVLKLFSRAYRDCSICESNEKILRAKFEKERKDLNDKGQAVRLSEITQCRRDRRDIADKLVSDVAQIAEEMRFKRVALDADKIDQKVVALLNIPVRVSGEDLSAAYERCRGNSTMTELLYRFCEERKVIAPLAMRADIANADDGAKMLLDVGKRTAAQFSDIGADAGRAFFNDVMRGIGSDAQIVDEDE